MLCVGGSRYHNMKDLMRFPDVGRGDLRFEPWPACAGSRLRHGRQYARPGAARRRTVPLSLSELLELSAPAARGSPEPGRAYDPDDRLPAGPNSKVVRALICAARHGKQVTAVVELMARFDEASNIDWAKEECRKPAFRVIFGVEGLKVHAKLTHIGSSRGDIACVSTGNFHEGNARNLYRRRAADGRPGG